MPAPLVRVASYAGYAASVLLGEWMLLQALSMQAYRGMLTPHFLLALLLLGAAGILGFRLVRRDRADLPRLFLLIALPIQVGYAFLMLPFAPSDELAHVNRIFDNRPGELDLTVPAQIPQGNNGWIHSYAEIVPLLNIQFDYDQMGHSGRVTDKYSQLNYLVPSLFAQVGMALGVNAYLIVYAARLWNAAVFLLVAYWVLRRLPAGQKIALVFLLNPIVVHQMGSASADALTLTAAFGFVGQLLYMRMSPRESFPAREWAILCVLGVLNVLCKYAYAPLFFCVFLLMPKIRRRWVRVLVPVAALAGCAGFVPLLLAHGYADHLRNMALTFTPEMFAGSLWMTLTQYSDTLLWQFAGGNLGWPVIGGTWADVSIDVPVVWVAVVVLMALAFLSSGRTPWLRAWERAFCVAVGAAITLIILATFTMGYSDPIVITGVIGRYFIPQAFLTLLALLLPRPVPARLGRVPEVAFLAAMAVANVVSLGFVVAFFL